MYPTPAARALALALALALPAAVIVCAPAAAQQPKIPPHYKASPLEVSRLPKFCYGQYVDGSLTGEYSIPSACGVEMNHFCPALVAMVKAQDINERKAERVGYLGSARNDIQYTIRGMQPGCPIAPDVMAAKQRAEILSKVIK